jgi:hypothetical protein
MISRPSLAGSPWLPSVTQRYDRGERRTSAETAELKSYVRWSIKAREMSEFAPTLRVDEIAGRVRLSLDGFFSAEGTTLQEAADELVWKMLVAVTAFRCHGISGLGTVGRPNLDLVGFLWELGEIAAAGGDIRERLFGSSGIAAQG